MFFQAVRLFDESQDSIDAHNEGSRVTVVREVLYMLVVLVVYLPVPTIL